MRRACRVVRRQRRPVHAAALRLACRTLAAGAARACVRPTPRPCLLRSDILPWLETGPECRGATALPRDTASQLCTTYALAMKREEGSLAGLDVLLERWRVQRATCRGKSAAIAELLASCLDTHSYSNASHDRPAGAVAQEQARQRTASHTSGQEVRDMEGGDGATVAWLVQRVFRALCDADTAGATAIAYGPACGTAGELLWVLCYAVRSTEVPATAVQQLMRCLLDRLYRSHAGDVEAAGNAEAVRAGAAAAAPVMPRSIEEGIVQVMRVAVPLQLAAVVLSLTTLGGGDDVGAASPASTTDQTLLQPLLQQQQQHSARGHAALAFGISRAWQPVVSPTLARHCLRFVAGALHTSDRKILQDGSCVTTAVQSLLQECVYCALPACTSPDMCSGVDAAAEAARTPRDRTPSRLELAKASVYALKHAPCMMLCHLMAYYEAERLADRRLRNTFLGRCGTTVLHLTQAGLYLDTAAQATLQRTMSALLTTPSADAQDVEQGLVHGCMLWHALGQYGAVRAVYRSHPTLRETAFSVSACVRMGDVAAALRALRTLAASRTAGWPRLSPAVMEAMADVSRLVGARGVSAQVAELYDALVAFRNASLLISHLLSVVLAGLCDRVTRLTEELGPTSSLQPRRVLEHILPMLRAVLAYIGDDFNADVILDLLDVALRVEHVAVPLITGIVWTLQQARGLAVRDLFRPCDTTATDEEAKAEENTAGAVPFVKYYVLCNARTCYRRDGVLDHLLVVWQLDRAVVWRRRATELVPPYKLWRCASCGRANSDRYNYCLCTALQHSHVRCAACGYAQDERLSRCRSCGRAMSARAIRGVVLRQVWSCRECGAKNPARQTLYCLHCHAASGPLFARGAAVRDKDSAPAHTHCTSEANGASSSSRSFCRCATAERYAQQVGYCHRCGVFRDAYAAKESAVWRCPGCKELRSSLERGCPRCPQVECLPAATLRRVDERRYCHECGRPVQNAFAVVCPHCHASEEWLRCSLPPSVTADTSTTAESAEHEVSAEAEAEGEEEATPKDAASGAAADTTSDAPVVVLCTHCGTVQSVHATDTASSSPVCSRCGTALSWHGASPTAEPLEQDVRCASCKHRLPQEMWLSLVCPRCGRDAHAAVLHAHDVAAPSQAWLAMTLVHSCNAFMQCLMHDKMQTCSPQGTHNGHVSENDVGVATATLQPLCLSAQTERTLRDVLATVLQANKAGTETASSRGSSGGAGLDLTLYKTQLDMCVAQLPRGAALQSHLQRGETRRAAALVKRLIAQLYVWCTHKDNSTVPLVYDETERCEHCLGGHPASLCGVDSLCTTTTTTTATTATTSEDEQVTQDVTWQCEVCGMSCRNAGLQRYFCPTCLTLRDEVQRLMPAECWLCTRCGRANVEFETYCICCGAPAPPAAEGASQRIPFLPAKCATCGTVFLCSRCPHCTAAEREADTPPPPPRCTLSLAHPERPATPRTVSQQLQQHTLCPLPPPEPLVQTHHAGAAPIVQTPHLVPGCATACTLPVSLK